VRPSTRQSARDRNVTGNLSGLFRVKFDVADRPERFRLVYRHVGAELVEIVVVGERDEHAVYRDALARLTDND